MKKFLSVFLCVLLLFTVVILPASAEGDVINNYVNETDLSPVTAWLVDIYDSISDIPNKILDVYDMLVSKLQSIIDYISNGFDDLGDLLRTKFTDLQNSFSNAISSLKTSLSNLIGEVKDRVLDTVNQIKSIYTWLGDTRDRVKTYVEDKLEYLFVPKFSFEDKLNEWKTTLSQKFGFFDRFFSMLIDSIGSYSETSSAPKFEFTYKGTTVGLIDFAPYAYMRPVVHGIILAFAWFSFLRRLIHSVPGLIMSASGASARVTANETSGKE